MNQLINKNLSFLKDTYHTGSRGAVLYGGSRSGKSWSCIDFIIYLCSIKELAGSVIYIVKETYNSHKTTLYNDFNKRLEQFGMGSPMATVKDVQQFNLLGCKIHFLGADQPAKFHGAGCNFFWINEAIDVQEAVFHQLDMRCSSFWFMDFNPKSAEHWIYNKLEKRPDVGFCHSTMLDNPFIGKWERAKILGYEPTAKNKELGTADSYLWSVYGLGLRSDPQGLVFPLVEWIDEFPDNIEQISHAIDFGYTNSPTAIVKAGRNGRNLFFELLHYAPCDNANDLCDIIKATIPPKNQIWADSADPNMIAALQQMRIQINAVRKYPGSIAYGIGLMKSYKIHIVRNADARREQALYKWREINGTVLNDPIDDHNHFFDAARYSCMSTFNN